jgi:hypothetical protein
MTAQRFRHQSRQTTGHISVSSHKFNRSAKLADLKFYTDREVRRIFTHLTPLLNLKNFWKQLSGFLLHSHRSLYTIWNQKLFVINLHIPNHAPVIISASTTNVLRQKYFL